MVVGAELDKNGNFTARVKLMSSHLQASISLSLKEWKLLNFFIKEMRLFFNKKIDTQIINCQTFLLRFIIWNNHRLVSVERVSKNSLSHPFVTMQESTFFVLEELNFCIRVMQFYYY